MSVFAAVMTGPGIAAIATIEVYGNQARSVINQTFELAGKKAARLETGRVFVGWITDGAGRIDQVTIGCEGPGSFAIHCHGNPLIVEKIVELLERKGATVLTGQQFLERKLLAEGMGNSIAREARLLLSEARTVEGSKLLMHQIDAGLNEWSRRWAGRLGRRPAGQEGVDLTAQIRRESAVILRDSEIARRIIRGSPVVLAGPANSGKSTLLNLLSGREKAIVTEIEGTTRDYVTGRCRVGPMEVDMTDTAGLDEQLVTKGRGVVQAAAQQRTLEVLEAAELVLLVLDGSRGIEQAGNGLVAAVKGRKVLTVLNKSDLPLVLDLGKLPAVFGEAVLVSAKFGSGVERLVEKMEEMLGVGGFSLERAVCVSERQERLVERLAMVEEVGGAVSVIEELLNGPMGV